MAVPIIQPKRVAFTHGKQRNKLKAGYQKDSFYEDGEEDPNAYADMAMATNVGRVLTAHYPGHFWNVECSHRQGVVLINIPILMGQIKYNTPIRELWSDPGGLSVMRAAGEILERFNIPRTGFEVGHFREALARRPIGKRDYAGE